MLRRKPAVLVTRRGAVEPGVRLHAKDTTTILVNPHDASEGAGKRWPDRRTQVSSGGKALAGYGLGT